MATPKTQIVLDMGYTLRHDGAQIQDVFFQIGHKVHDLHEFSGEMSSFTASDVCPST